MEVIAAPALSALERRIMRVFTVGLIAALLAIPLIAALSRSPVANVFLGLLPLLLTLVLDIAAARQHYRKEAFWIVLITVHLVGLAGLALINPLLAVQMNAVAATIISLLLGCVITALASWERPPREEKKPAAEEFAKERLPEYVQSIEDKAKGINFAIGRVYRASNGGTAEVREKLRILREWYNEFYEIKPEELEHEQEKAALLIKRIHDRLHRLAQKEKEVFSEQELRRLKHLARNKNGEDAIIDVLKTNDSDPVENYYVSAVELCERILEGLEK